MISDNDFYEMLGILEWMRRLLREARKHKNKEREVGGIKAGDTVSVNFNNSQHTLCEKAMVICVPEGIGDHWCFRDLNNNCTYLVSEPCTVIKRDEK